MDNYLVYPESSQVINKSDVSPMPIDYSARTKRLEYFEQMEREGRLLIAPCNLGDTVYILDCLNNVMTKKVKSFTISVVDEDGNHHIPSFGNGIYTDADEAADAVAKARQSKCHLCYLARLDRGDSVKECEDGGCRNLAIVQTYHTEWEEEARKFEENKDKKICNQCFREHAEKQTQPPCENCSGKHFREEADVSEVKDNGKPE